MEENNNGVCLERGCLRERDLRESDGFVKSERNEERELNEKEKKKKKKKRELREEKHRKSHVSCLLLSTSGDARGSRQGDGTRSARYKLMYQVKAMMLHCRRFRNSPIV
ncbi:hypothetical protein MTR_8g072415 [Medicago truncatula]|uniref:Uncharacterized protein n=1 Tax=Medicago truncatula TaxID=3880 RepID=A0A072TS41_MEDTR|nr:hypothetical protein MTR_8g072415 [Medicago truncatula]